MIEGGSEIRDVGTDELRSGLADGSILVVDVREPNEHLGGMIPGSLAMPLSRFDPSALPTGEGKRIVFSCAAGVRSRVAIEVSRRAGLDVSEHYLPGFKGWVAAGGAVEPLG